MKKEAFSKLALSGINHVRQESGLDLSLFGQSQIDDRKRNSLALDSETASQHRKKLLDYTGNMSVHTGGSGVDSRRGSF